MNVPPCEARQSRLTASELTRELKVPAVPGRRPSSTGDCSGGDPATHSARNLISGLEKWRSDFRGNGLSVFPLRLILALTRWHSQHQRCAIGAVAWGIFVAGVYFFGGRPSTQTKEMVAAPAKREIGIAPRSPGPADAIKTSCEMHSFLETIRF